ncbi:unnamed protein product [Linum trigynum]|uniref:Uncharacterized protein n=2 Tax=Linum trigynum TaxID=586398 RepID=A0AAV2E676_9ROSI
MVKETGSYRPVQPVKPGIRPAAKRYPTSHLSIAPAGLIGLTGMNRYTVRFKSDRRGCNYEGTLKDNNNGGGGGAARESSESTIGIGAAAKSQSQSQSQSRGGGGFGFDFDLNLPASPDLGLAIGGGSVVQKPSRRIDGVVENEEVESPLPGKKPRLSLGLQVTTDLAI